MSDRNALFDSYLTKHYSHVKEPNRDRQIKKAYLAHNYAKLLPSPINARILDIGPGYGELIELLTKDHGYINVQAIDLSREVVDYCNKIEPNSTAMVSSTHEFLANHTNQFDCIFMLHLLEHVPKVDIIPLLHATHNALTSQGRLIVETPNMANPFIGLNIRYADFTHEVGFTELSIRYVLESTNFSKIHIFSPTFPLVRYTKLLQAATQIPIKLMLSLMYRAYSARRPKVVSPNLSTLAIK